MRSGCPCVAFKRVVLTTLRLLRANHVAGDNSHACASPSALWLRSCKLDSHAPHLPRGSGTPAPQVGHVNILANTREEARAKLGSLDPSGLAALRASSTALAAASAASASSGSSGKPLVGIIMGSDSDLATMKGAAQVGGGQGWHVARSRHWSLVCSLQGRQFCAGRRSQGGENLGTGHGPWARGVQNADTPSLQRVDRTHLPPPSPHDLARWPSLPLLMPVPLHGAVPPGTPCARLVPHLYQTPHPSTHSPSPARCWRSSACPWS